MRWRDVVLRFTLMQLAELDKVMGTGGAARFQQALDRRAPELALGAGRWRDNTLHNTRSNYARDGPVNPINLTGGELLSLHSRARLCSAHTHPARRS